MLLVRSPQWNELEQFDGNADAIEKTARDYRILGRAMVRTADTLRDITESQVSKGTDRLKDDAEKLEGDLRKAAVRYLNTGEALKNYPEALRTAKGEYTKNAPLIRDAMDAYREAETTAFAPPVKDEDTPDEGKSPMQKLGDAEDDLRDAWKPFDTAFSAWETAYERAADGVAEAMDKADNDDGKWDWIADALKIIGYAIIVLAVAALFVVSSPWSTILLAATIALSAIHLAGTIYLYANGKASLSDVLWSTFGLVTAGAGGLLSRGMRGAAAGADDLLGASRIASDLPVFTRGARGFSMPNIPSGLAVNPFSTMARGQSWAVLNKWGGSLSQWASTPARSGTIAAAWGEAVTEAVPRIGAVGFANVGNWTAGFLGGVYSSSPFYQSWGRP